MAKMVTVGNITVLFCLFALVLSNQSIIERIIVSGKYEDIIELDINRTIEYVIEYKGNEDKYPVKVIVSSPSSTKEQPLLIVAQQQKRITSWQLPYIVNPLKAPVEYFRAGHILCPANSVAHRSMSTRAITPLMMTSNPVITIKSPGDAKHRFTMTAHLQRHFFLKNSLVCNSSVSASTPTYYFYNFLDEGNEAKDSSAVLVEATSETRECMLISVQNSTCPVFDLENNIKFDSYWQTMNLKAGIVVTKKHYPNGFYVVMVVSQDHSICNDDSVTLPQDEKLVSIKVTNTITAQEHFTIAISTVAIFAGIFVICTIISILYLIRSIQMQPNETSQSDRSIQMQPNETSQSVRSIQMQPNETSQSDEPKPNKWRQLFQASLRSTSSTTYVWHVGIVALFYFPPVLQLVVTYQRIVHITGNEDLCYYNFLCAHPLEYISDFNHVFSNIGYVFLGLLFIIITYVKELLERSTQREMYGIPKPYGMFYALGFALIMEGIMSACYHICPKSSNFQFDTSFMYVMSVLMVVNVYENRHCTGDRRGYAVFGILAAATTLSTIALVIGDQLYFWIIFGILQISLCFTLTWALDKSLFKRIFDAEERQNFTGVHICRIVLWIIGNVINWLIVAYGIYARSEFGTYLLIVFIINGLFYTIYYISMKICYKERILVITWIFMTMATIVWGVAIYFFVTNVTSWEKSPAESRNMNQECALVRYYDSHDIWHFLSSVALFFTFIVLLTLDEGLADVPRADITDFHTH